MRNKRAWSRTAPEHMPKNWMWAHVYVLWWIELSSIRIHKTHFPKRFHLLEMIALLNIIKYIFKAGLFEFLLSLREAIKHICCGRQGTKACFFLFLELNLEYKVNEGALSGRQLSGSPRSTAVASGWAEGQAGAHQSLLVHSPGFPWWKSLPGGRERKPSASASHPEMWSEHPAELQSLSLLTYTPFFPPCRVRSA